MRIQAFKFTLPGLAIHVCVCARARALSAHTPRMHMHVADIDLRAVCGRQTAPNGEQPDAGVNGRE
jgi:hypothetical protein